MTTTQNPIVIKTADQLRRSKFALAETRQMIENEMEYSEDLRDSGLITKYQEHVKNLEAAIAAYPSLDMIWTEEEISQDTFAELQNRGVDFERISDEDALSLYSWFDADNEVAFRVIGGGNVMWVVR